MKNGNITITRYNPRPRRSGIALISAACGLSACILNFSMPVHAEENPEWRPAPTERLVKLPGVYLKKVIERDFSESGLADAIGDRDTRIAYKAKTLADLRDAVDDAKGKMRTEFRHQFLAEKREYVKLLGERQDLHRKQLRTKIRLYGRILNDLKHKSGSSEATQQLLKKQEEARERLERTTLNIDMKVFSPGVGGESRYSREYQKNIEAVKTLMAALKDHPMNAKAEIDGKRIGKKDYVRLLATNAEAEIALLDQEETILGYMAKLVALDAMGLAENLDEEGDFVPKIYEDDGDTGISSTIGLFTSR
jgi:hypothetical protein